MMILVLNNRGGDGQSLLSDGGLEGGEVPKGGFSVNL